jgi:hypothetical protein
MWFCFLVRILAPALIDDEPRSSMSNALPPPPRGGLIRPRRMGLYRTGPPPTRRVGLGGLLLVALGWVASCSSRWVGLLPARRVGLGWACPPTLGWVASNLPLVVLSWVALTLPLVVAVVWGPIALLVALGSSSAWWSSSRRYWV